MTRIRPENRPEAAGPARAWLARLKLTDFRNYAALALDLDARPVVLTGENGAGKTNLLEAVSFLSPGRGLRRASLETVARHSGSGAWAVAATLERPGGAVEIGTGLLVGDDGPEKRRAIRLNHAPARSAEALVETLRVLWLTPSMDGLFTGPASDRRRFLDRMVLALDRAHGTRVNAFEQAMRGRNRLLEDHAPDPAWLAALERQMAELGTAIAAARLECVSLLARHVAGAEGGPFPAAGIALSGTLEEALAGADAGAAEDAYERLLASGRERDRAAGRTLAGPHLTDMSVTHLAKDMPAGLASTGEQKALLVGLVLAHARLTAALTGETPLLLLDEIAAHLDAGRRAALFDILVDLGAQTFMTGTDSGAFSALSGRALCLAVAEGRIREI